MNGADTAWIIVATALVLFMTLPGLALFYGGLVRSRNVLSVLMQCFSIACVMSILWLALGYSIAFGDGGAANAYWGGYGKMFLNGITPDTVSELAAIPEVLFFAFQMTFAIITPALIVGAYVERIGFGFVIAFSSLWMLLCYAPVTHWIWGGGWLADMGVMDFAGGIVVHETAGIAALVVAFMLGSRRGFPKDLKPPHNPGMTMIGAAMLWVGWFGFNAGSQLAADGGAAMALVVTHISAATASITWAAYEKIKYGKFSMIGLVTGTIAGLASITPASGFVGPVGALFIGAVAGVLCQVMCGVVKDWMKIDDSLDVFAVHGVGGIFGTLMAPLLAMNALEGGQGLMTQIIALIAVGIFTLIVTVAIAMLCKALFGLRVDEEDEIEGLDYTAHGERAYDMVS